jgi:hypothetical protein
MPSKYFFKASLEYGIGSKLALQKIGRVTPTMVTIEEHVEVGYDVCPQVIHARIDSGEDKLAGKKVVVKLYDPLYVSPELVFTDGKLPGINQCGLTVLASPPSTADDCESELSSVGYDMSWSNEETLAGSTVLLKKDLLRVDPASKVLFLSQVSANACTDPLLDGRTITRHDLLVCSGILSLNFLYLHEAGDTNAIKVRTTR